MCFDVERFKEHPWEELQLEIQLHVPHGQSGHAELTLADLVCGGHIWFTACGRICWQRLSELQDTQKTGKGPSSTWEDFCRGKQEVHLGTFCNWVSDKHLKDGIGFPQ